MKNQELQELFNEQLTELYSAQNQIVKALPNLIKQISLPELKEALTKNLRENENQVKRLEQIFSNLNIDSQENNSEPVENLINQIRQTLQNRSKSPVLDAAVLTAILKLKHYKIATYNAMKNLANNLHLQNEVLNTLQESLNEVNNADKILERIFEKSLNNLSTSQREPAGAGGFSSKNRN